jgi:hypothetical protein
MWLPAWLPDIESDMSAVHRVDDIYSMPAARFFRLAWRLPHYQGVIRDRVLALQREQEDEPQATAAPPRQQHGPVRKPTARAQPVTEAALSDPVMSRIFEFS